MSKSAHSKTALESHEEVLTKVKSLFVNLNIDHVSVFENFEAKVMTVKQPKPDNIRFTKSVLSKAFPDHLINVIDQDSMEVVNLFGPYGIGFKDVQRDAQKKTIVMQFEREPEDEILTMVTAVINDEFPGYTCHIVKHDSNVGILRKDVDLLLCFETVEMFLQQLADSAKDKVLKKDKNEINRTARFLRKAKKVMQDS